MFFSLEVLPARKGDCLLLHYGEDEPRLVMIDGGPSDVFRPHLRPSLDRIRKARKTAAGAALMVDMLLVSHVDDDHIKGILDLTSELRQAKQEKKPLLLRTRSLWHNSFDKILNLTPQQLQKPQQFGTAALAGEVPVEDDVEEDVAKILASIPQGFQLREDAKFLQWPINREFGEDLIVATGEPRVVMLEETLRFTVIGPMQAELKRLRKRHNDWVNSKKANKETSKTLAAYLDRSVPNLSSIVLLAEIGNKRMLLTGDARGDMILKGLELAKVMKPGSSIHLDLLKVPHHGSSNNMEIDFFRRVTADHYIFSGNGEHGNPERETLEMLLEARGQKSFTMHFTYPVTAIDEEREKDWIKEQGKERARKKKGANQPVRPDWNPEKHGLVSLLQNRDLPSTTQRIAIIESGKPHRIDLLDPITF